MDSLASCTSSDIARSSASRSRDRRLAEFLGLTDQQSSQGIRVYISCRLKISELFGGKLTTHAPEAAAF